VVPHRRGRFDYASPRLRSSDLGPSGDQFPRLSEGFSAVLPGVRGTRLLQNLLPQPCEPLGAADHMGFAWQRRGLCNTRTSPGTHFRPILAAPLTVTGPDPRSRRPCGRCGRREPGFGPIPRGMAAKIGRKMGPRSRYRRPRRCQGFAYSRRHRGSPHCFPPAARHRSSSAAPAAGQVSATRPKAPLPLLSGTSDQDHICNFTLWPFWADFRQNLAPGPGPTGQARKMCRIERT
jgi:hypothetical protein